MKYLYITNGLFPIERVDVGVLFGAQLPKRGHRIDIVFQPREPGRARREKWGGGTAWLAGRSGAQGPGAQLGNACRRYWNVARSIFATRRADYDFIQVRDGHLSGLIALLGATLTGRPFVYWMSFPVAEHRRLRSRTRGGVRSQLDWLLGTLGQATLRHLLLRRAVHVFVQSDRMAADLEAWGIPNRKTTAVPMGVDPDTTRPITVEKPARERWIGYLGTLDRTLNNDLIVDAFAKVSAVHAEARLILVGSAERPVFERLHRRIDQLALRDRVVITGQRARSEALGYMQACEICLAPSAPLPLLQSTSPTKLVEYLFLGKPVVASEHPEQRELLDACGGGLCVKHDAEAFAGAMLVLLDDPQRRAAMGARGRDYVLQHRTYDRIAAEVDDRYRRLFSR